MRFDSTSYSDSRNYYSESAFEQLTAIRCGYTTLQKKFQYYHEGNAAYLRALSDAIGAVLVAFHDSDARYWSLVEINLQARNMGTGLNFGWSIYPEVPVAPRLR